MGRGGNLRLATTFLTRLPLPGAEPRGESDLTAAAGAFPVIGGVIGGIGGLVFLGAGALNLSAPIAAILAVAAMALVTGGLHEDGLADTVDGFGGGGNRDEKLAIMRDSRIGAFGVLALIVFVALRIAALSQIGGLPDVAFAAPAALVSAGAVSRAVMPVVVAALMPARRDGLGAGMRRPGWAGATLPVVIGGVIAGLSLSPFGWWPILWSLAAAAAAMTATATLAMRQVGGYTGDILGTVQQTAETAILVALAATIAGGNV